MDLPKSLFLLQGNHLFPPSYLKSHKKDLFLMLEDREQMTTCKYHKHKLVFCLSAMRHYAHELRHYDFNLLYFELYDAKTMPHEKLLQKVLTEGKIKKIITFEIEDHRIESRLQAFCQRYGYELEVKPSPQFLLSREDFKNYLEQHGRPSVKKFYEIQRQRLNILMDPSGAPLGGRFSFADEERLRWSKKNGAPKFPVSVREELDLKVIHLVEKEFPDHHGDAHTFWYPTGRAAAQEALEDFCKYRLAEFGPYDDTICPSEDFLFHSVLSPLLNVGLLLPKDVLNTVIQYAKNQPVSLNSLESFTKKVLGYREFARGIYRNFNEFQEQSNFWQHHRLPTANWYTGQTGVLPLDDAIKKALRLSYNHLTERLKIICNMMNLSEISPPEVYRWFNEMQMDSAAWALGPNVYGLGLQSDGGIFTSKLHIYGTDHWFKISSYSKADWALEVDGLYWRFIEKHKDYLVKNPRLSVMPQNLEKMSAEKRESLERAAEAFLARNTSYP